ncbi:hypothetical protein [Fretibacter rubidus]|uniref:hypothetical protein n=1 Tax=Fretibacter rubidus TaxID=570162 RepID=UPI00352A0BFA
MVKPPSNAMEKIMRELSTIEVNQVNGGIVWAIVGAVGGALEGASDALSDDGKIDGGEALGIAGKALLGAVGGRAVGLAAKAIKSKL